MFANAKSTSVQQYINICSFPKRNIHQAMLFEVRVNGFVVQQYDILSRYMLLLVERYSNI